ncbi:MAG: hypothetical protein ACE5QW_08775 [Thermoplasmata archaeon]
MLVRRDLAIGQGGSVDRKFPDGMRERIEGPALERWQFGSKETLPEMKPLPELRGESPEYDDPTMYFKGKALAQVRDIGRERLVHGTSAHRAKLVALRNGKIQAEQGFCREE